MKINYVLKVIEDETGVNYLFNNKQPANWSQTPAGKYRVVQADDFEHFKIEVNDDDVSIIHDDVKEQEKLTKLSELNQAKDNIKGLDLSQATTVAKLRAVVSDLLTIVEASLTDEN